MDRGAGGDTELSLEAAGMQKYVKTKKLVILAGRDLKVAVGTRNTNDGFWR
jgi:hypothetical protein